MVEDFKEGMWKRKMRKRYNKNILCKIEKEQRLDFRKNDIEVNISRRYT